MTSSPPAGLRERKKAKTRAAIREHAMRLFEERGYAATTVDQIAEAADVSQSTFFRYFPTKEDLVVTDDYDPMIVAAMRALPPEVDPIEAIRRSIHDVFAHSTQEQWDRERQRQRLFTEVPELRARAVQQFSETINLLAGVVAERAGLPAGNFSARVLAGAVIGAVIGATPSGMVPGQSEVTDFARLDEGLHLLLAGLPLRPDAPPPAAAAAASDSAAAE
jgi:AcrR family transcriptional regulator